VSYRIIGAIVTWTIAFIATGKLSAATAIGLLDAVVKIGVFYLHERLWLRINYGRRREPEYHI
jgi:uncharacterized membrane protein